MFPAHWSFRRIVTHYFCESLTNQSIIRKQLGENMSALTDLQAAVSKLATDVNAFISANSGGATDAQLTTLTAQVNAIDAVVNPPAAS